MCTGAEVPALAGLTAATAGTAAAGTTAAATAGAAAAGGAAGAGLADAGLTALTAAPEMAAGMAGGMDAVPGLLSATPNLAGFDAGLGPTFGAGGMGMTDAGGSTLAGAPGAANPFSIGLGNFQNSTIGQGLGRGMDALGNANKAQSAMNMFSPHSSQTTTSVQRPPGMGQPAQNVSQGSMGRPMGGLMGSVNPQQGGLDSAKLMMLKRMGLLGSM